jgi:hypothetical protein
MNSIRIFFSIILGGLLLGVAGMGCKKQESAAPATLPMEQVASTIQQTFASANPDLQAQASALQTAVQQKDPGALTALEAIQQRSDLTGEQRQQISQCLPSLLQSTREAASAGDARAAQALKAYHVSK